MKDKVIIDKIKNGDKKELASIYTAYRSEFISWISGKYDCSVNEARDIYQMSIMTFHENIINGKLTELSSSIKTYLFAIGKNKYLELRKSKSRYVDNAEFELFNMPEISILEQEEREKKIQLVERCLERLGDPCRSLLELYYFHDMSMEDIAEKLDYKNSSTTKNLKYKCLKRLRKIFNEEHEKVVMEDLDK